MLLTHHAGITKSKRLQLRIIVKSVVPGPNKKEHRQPVMVANPDLIHDNTLVRIIKVQAAANIGSPSSLVCLEPKKKWHRQGVIVASPDLIHDVYIKIGTQTSKHMQHRITVKSAVKCLNLTDM